METGKVVQEHKTNYVVRTDEGEVNAVVRGSFHTTLNNYPKVGDIVHFTKIGSEQAVIEEVAERTSVIARKRAGTDESQVIVANANLIVIVMGLDQDFNINRLERYLLLAEQSNVTPLVVLNKSDLVDNPEQQCAMVHTRFPGVPVLTMNAVTGAGLSTLREYLHTGVTAVLLGSSGAGKSTITNQLLQEEHQATQGVREDDSHGRHTTTSRALFLLPSGGELIDTPGMRELGLLESTEGSEQFQDIEQLATQCTFSDCEHEKSRGCAIQQALRDGTLERTRFNNFTKLQKEREYAMLRQDEEHERLYREKERALHKKYRKILRGRQREQEDW